MEKCRSFPQYSSGYDGRFEFQVRSNPNSYSFNGTPPGNNKGFAPSSDSETKRKRRVASYNKFIVEGKLKSSVKNSFKWIKNKLSNSSYEM